ncbi:hypothetical protein JOQ06_026639, partial [Pogonophryne albipinna]
MPVSLLWAVDVYGRVYSLSTGGGLWEQCRDAHMEFKRVTAAQQCCWGIACDNNIYLNLHASDLPVRYQEETYENQRWNPVDSFSDRLLPSDRWQWSDVTGLQHQPLDGFLLPSDSWEWEGDWHVDENFEGEPTEKVGWTYAIDFPAYYTKDKKWNSCVRRRRWLRYRRFRSMDTWAKIPPQQTTLPDPFSDISCGGWEINEEPRGRLSLWAVWFREGIYHLNPEGSVWEEVSLPGEVIQISCGPGDLVWAVLWEGQLLVREGVSRDCPKGTSWVTVDSPSPDVGATHVAVGVNVVWALTKDNKVWFRRGINSHNPCGSGWINMVGEMIMINVGLNDQVLAISSEDRAVAGIYFCGEVRAQSAVSDVESERGSTDGATGLVTSSSPESLVDAPTDQPVETPKPHIPKVTSDSFISELVSDREPAKTSREETPPAVLEEEPLAVEEDLKDPCAGVAIPPQDPQWCNVDLEEAQIQQTGLVLDSVDTCSLSSVATYTLAMEDPYGADERPLWAWVSGGGCNVDSHSQLNWFNSMNASSIEQSVWVSGAAMPVSLLWAVDVYGRVYSLSTGGGLWEQCRDAHMEFKRVTAAQQCCWGIACDNNIYLNLHASDLPVRYQEETYENQRWNPVDSFSDRLLPSDRWQWSDVTGLQHQPLDGFLLPSDSWEWEGDWHVDENFEGEPTEKVGWTYAIDFPAYYTKDKKWNSCVRRRRWLRYRRFRSMDTWAKIPPQQTTLPDPFSDISCGGWEINEEPRGRLSLWAVSLQGKVWFREGIYHLNPEGSVWEEVSLPGEVIQISCGPGDLVWAVLWEGQLLVREGVSRDCPKGTLVWFREGIYHLNPEGSVWEEVSLPGEVIQISCGPGDLVWAVLWEGQLLVREGVSRDCPKGTSWVTVDSPSPDVGATHVAVWFRRGINSHNPCGSGWINMVGEMIMINVGLNDQDRAVYFRQGVTSSELSGKTWRAITVPETEDRSHSSASASSLQ